MCMLFCRFSRRLWMLVWIMLRQFLEVLQLSLYLFYFFRFRLLCTHSCRTFKYHQSSTVFCFSLGRHRWLTMAACSPFGWWGVRPVAPVYPFRRRSTGDSGSLKDCSEKNSIWYAGEAFYPGCSYGLQDRIKITLLQKCGSQWTLWLVLRRDSLTRYIIFVLLKLKSPKWMPIITFVTKILSITVGPLLCSVYKP